MNKFLNPKCKKCGHAQASQVCKIDNTPIADIENGFCACYTESPYICEYCGRHLVSEQVIYTYGIQSSFHLLCPDCIERINTCNTCEKASQCRFENDHTIPEPAYVMKTIQQGPMIQQIQIKNPKRINLTCKVNCPCFHNDECIRDARGYCDNYECAVKNW